MKLKFARSKMQLKKVGEEVRFCLSNGILLALTFSEQGCVIIFARHHFSTAGVQQYKDFIYSDKFTDT